MRLILSGSGGRLRRGFVFSLRARRRTLAGASDMMMVQFSARSRVFGEGRHTTPPCGDEMAKMARGEGPARRHRNTACNKRIVRLDDAFPFRRPLTAAVNQTWLKEETMRILAVVMMVGFAMATAPVAVAQEKKASFLKPAPKSLGSKVSTVTTYETRKADGALSFKHCSATCAGSSQPFHWKCEVEPNFLDVICKIKCTPRPVEGLCLPL